MDNEIIDISIVIPCFNSESTLKHVVSEIKSEMNKLSQYKYEILLVNDCSKDRTIEVISKLCEDDNNIVGIDLAKNFGQHAALMAGFRYSRCEKFLICLDDDGQMPLESIGAMIELMENGADVVQGKYIKTKQKLFRRIGSWINSKMTEKLLSKPKDIEMNSFWGAKKFIIEEMTRYEGAYPYIAGLILRTTRNIVNLEVNHRERVNGKSGYSLSKLIRLWMNGFTAFSEKPLRFASLCGFICSISGMIFAIVTIVRKIINPSMLVGYASLITVILFIGGMIMMMLGILGEYIGRMYICMNKSPQYVVRNIINKK